MVPTLLTGENVILFSLKYLSLPAKTFLLLIIPLTPIPAISLLAVTAGKTSPSAARTMERAMG